MKFRTPEPDFGVRFSYLLKVPAAGAGPALILKKIHNYFTLAHSFFVRL